MSGPTLPHPELPASRNQLAKLGRRLAGGARVDGDDELYVRVLDAYDQVQTALVEQIKGIDWAGDMPALTVVGRTKTLDTLVQKLQRSPGIGLPYVRDIAGVRVVGDMSLVQQNGVASFLAGTLDGTVIDRRLDPQSGYRAVHVSAIAGGLPVEVQVRTRLQHLWAEIFERLADRWGRQLRYGGAPDVPGPAEAGGDRTPWTDRLAIVEQMQEISEAVYELEEELGGAHAAQLVVQPGPLADTVREAYGLPDPALPQDQLTQHLRTLEPEILRLRSVHDDWEHRLTELVRSLSSADGSSPPDVR